MTLVKLPDVAMPRDQEHLLAVLETVLEEDKGYVGQGLDVTRGLPQQLGTDGTYGDHGPFNVIVNPGSPGSSEIVLSAFSQSQVYRSEAIAALADRVAAKDKACNEVLIVTCGLVDAYGYICPADQSIFQLLREASEAGVSILPQKPANIRGILIHLWNSPFLFHWEVRGDLPWTGPNPG